MKSNGILSSLPDLIKEVVKQTLKSTMIGEKGDLYKKRQALKEVKIFIGKVSNPGDRIFTNF